MLQLRAPVRCKLTAQLSLSLLLGLALHQQLPPAMEHPPPRKRRKLQLIEQGRTGSSDTPHAPAAAAVASPQLELTPVTAASAASAHCDTAHLLAQRAREAGNSRPSSLCRPADQRLQVTVVLLQFQPSDSSPSAAAAAAAAPSVPCPPLRLVTLYSPATRSQTALLPIVDLLCLLRRPKRCREAAPSCVSSSLAAEASRLAQKASLQSYATTLADQNVRDELTAESQAAISKRCMLLHLAGVRQLLLEPPIRQLIDQRATQWGDSFRAFLGQQVLGNMSVLTFG